MKKELTSNYLSMFCTEMAMIISSGIELSDGVALLLDDAGKDGEAVLRSLLTELDDGAPLALALDKSGYFPRYMVGMVKTGEKTGRLADALNALAEYYDRMERMETAVKNVVFYPLILLLMMVTVVMVLIIMVLPIFNDVFGRFGSRMSPLATRLMEFGGWLGNFSAAIAAVTGAFFVCALLLWMFPKLRKGTGQWLRNRWGARGVFGAIAASRYVSVMSLSLASGLDVEEALDMAADVSGGTRAVDEKNKRCTALQRGGGTLSEAMLGAGILSAREARTLTLGAKSGMTGSAMAEIARRKDRNVQEQIERIIGRVEPTAVIVLSVIIGVILLSVMLPMMGIMTSIG